MPELVALVNKVRLRRAMLIDWPTKYLGNIGAGQQGEAEKSDADRLVHKIPGEYLGWSRR